MTFLAPWLLAAGMIAAAGIVTLHLIAWRRPPAAPFPTARFVPDGEARAASWSRRPADLLLLAVRVLALLMAAAAFARLMVTPRRAADVRVFVVDRSRAVGVATAAHDTLRSRFRQGDRVIAFDSAASRADTSASSLAPVGARGSISAGLSGALGGLREMARTSERVTLVVVTPLLREEVDSATRAIRALWPGPVELIRLPAAAADSASAAVTLVGAATEDPIVATLALATARRAGGERAVRVVRVVRTSALSAAELGAARAGATVVWWPVLPNDGIAEGALSGEHAVVVAPLARPVGAVMVGRPVARWLSAAPAAVERIVGSGCVREVRVPIPAAGDLVLSPSFVALLRELTAPCGGTRDFAPASASALAGPTSLANARAAAPDPAQRSKLSAWLLGGALLLLLVEPALRRTTPSGVGELAAALGDADVEAAA